MRYEDLFETEDQLRLETVIDSVLCSEDLKNDFTLEKWKEKTIEWLQDTKDETTECGEYFFYKVSEDYIRTIEEQMSKVEIMEFEELIKKQYKELEERRKDG